MPKTVKVNQKLEFSWSYYLFKWALTIAIPLMVWFLPLGIDPTFQLFLALTAWAVSAWVVQVLPNEAVAMTLPVLYLVFGLAPSPVVFSSYGAIPVWTTPGGILLGLAILVSGLGKRIAYWVLLRLKNYSVVSLSTAIVLMGMVIMFICPDNLARVAVMVPIGISICQILDYKPKSREATIIVLVAFFAGATAGLGILTSASQNIMINSIFAEVTGERISWVTWAMHNIIPSLIWVVISVFATIITLRPKKASILAMDSGAIQQQIAKEYQELGKVKAKELKVLLFVFAIVGMYLLDSCVGGLPFAPDWVFVLILPFFFVPGIDLLKIEDFDKTNFSIMFFIAGAISIGVVASHIGLTEAVSNQLGIMLEGGSPFKVVFLVWLFGVVVNFILTPLAALGAFTGVVLEMASGLGLNPVPLLYTLNFALDIYVFPYEYAILLFAFGYGYMHYGDVIKALTVRTLLGAVFIAAICYPFWKLIGLL